MPRRAGLCLRHRPSAPVVLSREDLCCSRFWTVVLVQLLMLLRVARKDVSIAVVIQLTPSRP